MAWIQQTGIREATGLLKQIFDAAMERAGHVWNIVRVMSINPETMQASLSLYQATMHQDSPLSRFQRELLATVVASELDCPY